MRHSRSTALCGAQDAVLGCSSKVRQGLSLVGYHREAADGRWMSDNRLWPDAEIPLMSAIAALEPVKASLARL
jgi:hypothetical protein